MKKIKRALLDWLLCYLILWLIYAIFGGYSTADEGLIVGYSYMLAILAILLVPLLRKFRKMIKGKKYSAPNQEPPAAQAPIQAPEATAPRPQFDNSADQHAYYAELGRQKRIARTQQIQNQRVNDNIQTMLFSKTLAELPRVPVELAPVAFQRDPCPDYADIKFSPITARTNLERVNDFVVIDVETTGLDPYNDEIVQLCAIRFQAFKPVDGFATYIKPRHGIKKEAAAVNGITAAMVKHAPAIDEAVNAFRAYVGDTLPLVGHNILFDIKFLTESNCLSLISKRKYYDTLELSRRFFSLPSYKLDSLDGELLHISREDAHDALSDCLATGMLFEMICKTLQAERED